jgi:hypothetical protein
VGHPHILCPRCGKKSANPHDIEKRYCGFCHLFHDDLPETIERAAVFYNGTIYSVPRPGRHHTVIREMAAQGLPDEAWQLANQGFETSTGRFVGRREAVGIARAAGQIIREPTPPDMLTSEDVW